MYAAGSDHPNKGVSVAFLDQVARGSIAAAIDTEVLQEILHRYRAIDRWEEGSRLYVFVRRIFSVFVPVTPEVLHLAHALMRRYATLVARDAVHAAVYEHVGARALCSFDRDFDRVSGVRRVEPGALLQ
jgi:predicted nucleic acid-binding protein